MSGRPKTNRVWVVDLNGPDGNAFVVLGTVGRIVRDVLGRDEEQAFLQRAMSGNYEHLLEVAREYVQITPSMAGVYELPPED